MSDERFLLIGNGGWVCGHIEWVLGYQGKNVHATDYRMEDKANMISLFDDFQPTRVINCAGKVDFPNADWCEANPVETVRSNVIGTMMLADLCHERGVHLTNLGTGNIYSSTYEDSTLASAPFTESDPPNFTHTHYALTRFRVEDILLKTYPNTLLLRLRSPVADDMHPRSLPTLLKEGSVPVSDIATSHSILHDLIPVAIAMSEHCETGVYNFTNPGAIGGNEVLGLYKTVVEPELEWEVAELGDEELTAASHCELDSGKLMEVVERYACEGEVVSVPPIGEGFQNCFERMMKNMQAESGADEQGEEEAGEE